MSELAAATSLCRVLLALARARATGVVQVQDESFKGAIALADGKLAGVSLSGQPSRCLGELLDELGAWDCRRHGEAVERGMPSAPVGDWLVAHGVSTQGAVSDALKRQLHERLTQIATWAHASFTFEPHLGGCGVTLNEAPLDIYEAVWAVMTTLACSIPPWRIRAELGVDWVKLSEEGEKFAHLEWLDVGQQAIFVELRRGAHIKRLVSAGADEDTRARCLWVLKVLGATTPASRGAYGLLLKKRRQLAREAPPHELLGVSERPSRLQARQALRRLVRELHPDRFSQSASGFLKRTSTEVVSALLRAEAQLKGF